MSASREKKQRQDNTGQGLTQRERKELKEAAAKKRKNIGYTVLGIVLAILVAALLIWNSGFFQRRSIAATVGDQEFTVQDVDFYYYSALNQQYQMYQTYAAYGITPPFDTSKPLSTQIYDEATGKSYQQYFQELALDALRRDTAACAEAQKQGYTLSAEGQKQVDDLLAQIDTYASSNNITRNVYLAQAYGKYMTEKAFIRNLTNEVLSGEFQGEHQNSLTYTDEQVQAYYDENAAALDSYDFRSFFISGAAETPKDADGKDQVDADGNPVLPTEEAKAAAMAAAQAKAEEAVAEIKANGGTGAAFGAAAPKYVDEASKANYEEDLDYSLQAGTVGSTVSSNFDFAATWLTDSARKPGDLTALESTANNGYYVVLLEQRYLVEDPTVNIRHILVKAETPEDDTATTNLDESATPTLEQLEAAKTEVSTLLDQWKSGDTTPEAFGALASEHSDDTGSASAGGRYTYVQQGAMFPAFDAWIFDSARKPGDTTLIENNQEGQQGWHAVYFEGQEKPYWTKTATDSLQEADQTTWMEGLLTPYQAVAAPGMSSVGR